MAVTWNDLCEVLDRFESELGSDEVGSVATLAFVELGGLFWDDPDALNPSIDKLIEMDADGSINQEARQSLERRIRYLEVNEYVSEDVLILGIIEHVKRRLEEFSEDSSKAAAQSRAIFDRQRQMLDDPSAREEQAERINHLLPPEIPRVSSEDIEPLLQRMHERYGQSVSLDQLRIARKRRDAWKRAIASIEE